MTLLYPQRPVGSVVAGQFAIHALVGGVADPYPSRKPPSSGSGVTSPQVLIKRDSVVDSEVEFDEDVVAALAFLLPIIEHDRTS